MVKIEARRALIYVSRDETKHDSLCQWPFNTRVKKEASKRKLLAYSPLVPPIPQATRSGPGEISTSKNIIEFISPGNIFFGHRQMNVPGPSLARRPTSNAKGIKNHNQK